MNLYKITFTHYAPKDSESGVKCLLLAENDEQVYEWMKSNPKHEEERLVYTSWADNEKYQHSDILEGFFRKGEDGEFDAEDQHSGWWDDNGNPITSKEYYIAHKGEQDVDFDDAYYGVTQYGWELGVENLETDFAKQLQEIGFLFSVFTAK